MMRKNLQKPELRYGIFEWIKIGVLCIFAISLPFLIRVKKASSSHQKAGTHYKYKLGLEVLTAALIRSMGIDIHKERIALVTNQTGLDQQGNCNIDLLLSKNIPLHAVVVPQLKGKSLHTYTNESQKIEVPIFCLYKKTKKGRVINEELLKNIDVLIFDMQDVGMRQYSYVNTLYDTMEAASYMHKKFIILDRPNLLGQAMEGPLLDSPSMASALAPLPIPVRYGMTIGELAQYINQHFLYYMANLIVVPMHNYKRSYPASELMGGLSPNIQTLTSCHGYSLLGLLGEVAPFDVGVGTSKAFQVIALSEKTGFKTKQWREVRHILKYYGIESSFYRYFNERKKQHYSGLQIRITDINNFSAIGTLLSLLDFFKKNGLKLTFSSSFDKALGTAKVRQFLAGKFERHVLEHEINSNLQRFFKQALNSFMYRPLPKIIET